MARGHRESSAAVSVQKRRVSVVEPGEDHSAGMSSPPEHPQTHTASHWDLDQGLAGEGGSRGALMTRSWTTPLPAQEVPAQPASRRNVSFSPALRAANAEPPSSDGDSGGSDDG